MVMNVKAIRNLFETASYLSVPYNKSSKASSDMVSFYKQGAENPSVAKAIAASVVTEKLRLPVRTYPNWFLHYKNLNKNPMVKAERENFENIYNKMYPRTGRLREVLIDNSRLSFVRTLPKMNDLQKQSINKQI